MKRRIARKVRQAKIWVRQKLYPSAMVLMYHRIGEPGTDPWSLCVSPENFEAQLKILRQQTHPMSLPDLAAAHRQGVVPERAVVITFDDGYANNLHLAKPILERLEIPATVFVTSGYLGSGREYWWDDLERMLLQPGQLPDVLQVAGGNSAEQKWQLGAAVHYSQADYEGDCAATAGQVAISDRMQFYHQVWSYLAPLPEVERETVLAQIQAWSGADSAARDSHRPMTPDEVQTLEAGGLIEVGAHTMTHPRLSAQSLDIQRQEIVGSKQALETLLQHEVYSFAYPFGDFVPETIPLVAEAGFTQACSTISETVWSKSHALKLPRFDTHNWNEAQFTKQLARWCP